MPVPVVILSTTDPVLRDAALSSMITHVGHADLVLTGGSDPVGIALTDHLRGVRTSRSALFSLQPGQLFAPRYSPVSGIDPGRTRRATPHTPILGADTAADALAVTLETRGGSTSPTSPGSAVSPNSKPARSWASWSSGIRTMVIWSRPSSTSPGTFG